MSELKGKEDRNFASQTKGTLWKIEELLPLTPSHRLVLTFEPKS